ncbi:MAG TPA: hypothetical protein IAB38_04590 [Candidatus Onthousia excrementipullorum]|uniref:Uncharacterized protein n=1 Tax=Candidatus Onthousia excrementipullorum TaxID=2840884 RepID=A0A9D1DUD9_9FIRM|nr:hypothetical protein [Candidatus Onthousia excrementipullorum]
MVTKIEPNNVFFKKMFLSFITVFSLFIVVGLSSNVSANVNSTDSVTMNVPSSGGGGGYWQYMYTAEPYAFYRHTRTKEWKTVQVTPTWKHVGKTIVNGYFNSYGNRWRP